MSTSSRVVRAPASANATIATVSAFVLHLALRGKTVALGYDLGHARAEVPETGDGLRCQMLFRHDTHTQSVMSLDVPAVIAVAPATQDFSAPADLDSIRVFRLEPLQPVVLHRGTWHWGPFPVDADSVRLFNVQGLRYAEDNACVDLASRGLAVDVVLA